MPFQVRIVFLNLETLRVVLAVLRGGVTGRRYTFFARFGALEGDDHSILFLLSHAGLLKPKNRLTILTVRKTIVKR